MKYDFEHYLRAGHGRAYLMAKEDPEKYREAIMNACRKDYTFDIQCEGSRAFLTVDLINLFDAAHPDYLSAFPALLYCGSKVQRRKRIRDNLKI